jgi:hypothetical protein
LSRTVRLPETASETQVNERLVAELKRTLAVTPSDRLRDDGIACVYVVGSPEDHQDLIDSIGEQLSLPAGTFDPFTALGVPEERVPPSRGRFASLLGMLLDEAAGKHAVDFLNPRRQPRPVTRWRIAAIAAAAVAVVILALAFHVWSALSEINQENRALTERLEQLKETMERAQKLKNRIEAIAAWTTGEVIWLDELRDLSIRFPSARDAMVLQMSMRPSQTKGGMIDFQGLVRDPKVVVNMESRIRDEYRKVRSRRVQERAVERDYTWVFESSMSVARRSKEHYVSHLPEVEQPVEPPEALAAARPSDDSKEDRP